MGAVAVGAAAVATVLETATADATGSLDAYAGALVKAGKVRLLSIDAQNNGAAVAYLHLFDKATAPVTGTDTPKFTYMIPIGGGKVNEKNLAILFALGFGYAITSGAGDLDNTNVTNADEVTVNFEYFAKG